VAGLVAGSPAASEALVSLPPDWGFDLQRAQQLARAAAAEARVAPAEPAWAPGPPPVSTASEEEELAALLAAKPAARRPAGPRPIGARTQLQRLLKPLALRLVKERTPEITV